MNPKLIEIKKLKFLECNPRTLSAPQLQKCVESLRQDPEFLNYRPILVNSAQGVMEIIAGSVRVRAAKQLGWTQIPALIFENLPEKKKKRLIILDNAHFGRNDDEILANEYDLDDLIAAGYTEKELSIDKEAIDMLDAIIDHNEKQPKEKRCPSCNAML